MTTRPRPALLLGGILLLMARPSADAAPAKTTGDTPGRRLLYDGAKGTTPEKQGWLFFTTGGGQTPPHGSGATTFSTLADRAFQGGYSTVSPFPLDRVRGYTIGFDLQVQAETHAVPNRSGVALIVLGHDRKGIELSFWTSQVWAQSDKPLFVHDEGTALDTTASGRGAAGLIHYELRMQGAAYRLLADGRPILNGRIRDYTAFQGALSPYQSPDFLFLGDDTHSAAGAFRVSRFWIERDGKKQ